MSESAPGRDSQPCTTSRTLWTPSPRVAVSLACLASVVAACSGTRGPQPVKPRVFDFQHEAGSTHVAVLSVTPWDEAVGQLQPTFGLTETQALEQVANATRAVDETFIDALSFGLMAGLPTTATEVTTTTTLGADGETTRESQRTDTERPGDASTLELPSGLSGGTTSPTPTAARPALAGMDPMLKHLSATALYQEVQLLNRYVRDAVQRTGFKAYVVRAQVSVLPSARHEPYDAYTTFSFFNGRFGQGPVPLHERSMGDALTQKKLLKAVRTTPWTEQERKELDELVAAGSAGEKGPQTATQSLEDQISAPSEGETPLRKRLVESELGRVLLARAETLRTCEGLRSSLAADFSGNPRRYHEYAPISPLFLESSETWSDRTPEERLLECQQLAREMPTGEDFSNPIVVPLLVTDNLESTIHSQVNDRVRQYAFALAFLLHGVGGQAELERYQRNLQTIFGQDLNSLLTVARVADNVYRVRLGAMQQVATSYVTVPRTHNVTFLLLAPCPSSALDKRIDLVSQTTWVDARSGAALAERAQADVDVALGALAQRYANYGLIRPYCGLEPVDLLVRLVPLVQTNDARRFSGELAATCPTLPAPFPKAALWSDLAQLMVASRWASTSLELPAWKPPQLPPLAGFVTAFDDGKKSTVVRLLGGSNLTADRVVATLRAFGTPGEWAFPADEVKVLDGGRVVQLTFPSLKAWLGEPFTSLSLDLACRGCRWDTTCVECEDSNRPPNAGSDLASWTRRTPFWNGGGEMVSLQSVGRQEPLSDLSKWLPLPGEAPELPQAAADKPAERASQRCTELLAQPDCDARSLACTSAVSYVALKEAKAEEKKKPGVNIKATARSIVTTGPAVGTLDLDLEFELGAPDRSGVKPQLCAQARIIAEGTDVLDIVSLTSPTIVLDPVKLLIKSSGRVRLSLANLAPGSVVKISAECKKGLDGTTSVTELPVVSTPRVQLRAEHI